MKKLLFSRSQKKHFSDTVVRIGKNNLGFSLVELIVIIAIMAVLVAIAIPVLGMFIEKARIANDKQAVTDVMYAINIGGQSMQYPVNVVQSTNDGSGLQIPVGFIVLSNSKDKDGNAVPAVMFIGSDDNVVRNSNGIVSSYNPGSGSNAAVMQQILADVLGEGYTYVLKYDGWSTTTNIPQLYGEANGLYSEMKDLCDDFVSLQSMSGITELIGYDIKSKFNAEKQDGYENGVDVVSTAAKTIITRFPTEEEFVQAWNGYLKENGSYQDKFYTTYAFGLSGTGMGMEAYTAVRRAYNEALANYVREHSAGEYADHSTINGYTFTSWDAASTAAYLLKGGHMVQGYKGVSNKSISDASPATHADYIVACGDQLAGVVVSDAVNPYMFDKDKHGGTSYQQTINYKNLLGQSKQETYTYYSGGTLNDEVQFCSDCKALVMEYRNSESSNTDARAFYKMMTTLYKTADEALSKADGKSGDDQWSYYDDLVLNFTNGYESLAAFTDNLESCIVITVYQGPEGLLYAECNTPGVLDE